jgi:hypothetical protein
MEKWEYMTLRVSINSIERLHIKLNELGIEGWELITLTPIESKSVGFFDSGSATSGFVAILKRRLAQ